MGDGHILSKFLYEIDMQVLNAILPLKPAYCFLFARVK